MADIFSNGYEEGDFSAWTAAGVSGVGATAEVIAGAAYAGSYGGHFAVTTGNVNSRGYAYKTFTAPANNFVAGQARFKAPAADAGAQFEFFRLNRVGTGQILMLRCINGTWELQIRNKDGTFTSQDLSAGLALNTWYLIEMTYDGSGANPVGKCYIDGVERASITDTTTGTLYVPDQVETRVKEIASGNGEAYYDEVRAADAYIGTGATEASTRLAAASTLQVVASQRLSAKSQLQKTVLDRLAAQVRLESEALGRLAGRAALQAIGAERLAGRLMLLKVAEARLAGGVFFEGGGEAQPVPSLRLFGLRLVRLVEVGIRRLGERQEE